MANWNCYDFRARMQRSNLMISVLNCKCRTDWTMCWFAHRTTGDPVPLVCSDRLTANDATGRSTVAVDVAAIAAAVASGMHETNVAAVLLGSVCLSTAVLNSPMAV